LAQNPELGDLFLKGKVSLCSIATAARSLQEATTKVEEIVGKSKKEVLDLVSSVTPVTKAPKEFIKPVLVKVAATPIPVSKPVQRLVQVSVTLTEDELALLEDLRKELSFSQGKNITIKELLLKLLKEKKERSRSRTTIVRAAKTDVPNSRYIPRNVKRAVFLRDKGQCSYTSTTGTRCAETKYLEYDHIQPFALGGQATIENLRLRCSCHNQMTAEITFGTRASPQKVAVIGEETDFFEEKILD
jgi:5-methylcytosine-specific restriction endonuclease McrA